MDSVSNVGVLDKAVAVLRALERAGSERRSPSCRRRPVCRERPPTAWPTALEQHGLVRRDADGRFCLGLALVGLGQAAADALPARRARPTRRSSRSATRRARACSCSSARATAGAASCRCSRAHGLRWIVAEGALLPLRRRLGRPGAVRSSSVRPAGSRASRSASPAWRRSARRSSTPTGGSLAAVSVSGPFERLSRRPGRTVRRRPHCGAATAIATHLRPRNVSEIEAIRAQIGGGDDPRRRWRALRCAAEWARIGPISYPPELPITARRDDLLAAIRDHQVVVVAGETGSGKSTQLPEAVPRARAAASTG